MTQPSFQSGDHVECRAALSDDWFPAVVTVGRRRANGPRNGWWAVGVSGGGWTDVNWPIEDVRRPEEKP